jgi:hypothetical protein
MTATKYDLRAALFGVAASALAFGAAEAQELKNINFRPSTSPPAATIRSS